MFLKAHFFFEFDKLLKEHEEKPNSLLMKFIEKTLTTQLKEHVDNSNKVVRISKQFLVNNAVLS